MSKIDVLNGKMHGSGVDSFRNLFEAKWKEYLFSLPEKYRSGSQLRIGSRFRPLLVAWGYLLSGSSFGIDERTKIAGLAVHVEALHKATLLIDDLIDGDKARHGRPAFHVEFSSHEAILVAIYLLGDCLEKLTETAKCFGSDELKPDVNYLLAHAIKNMAFGGIEEVNLDEKRLGSVLEIRRVIELQTAELVKYCLLVGFKFGHGNSDKILQIAGLGNASGYLFQALNDLEPFFGARRNAIYKGSRNLDITRLRKNLLMANLIDKLDKKQLHELQNLKLTPGTHFSDRVDKWLDDYEVIQHVAKDLSEVRQTINRTISFFPVDQVRRDSFLSFTDHVLSNAISRLDTEPRRLLSEVLVMHGKLDTSGEN